MEKTVKSIEILTAIEFPTIFFSVYSAPFSEIMTPKIITK